MNRWVKKGKVLVLGLILMAVAVLDMGIPRLVFAEEGEVELGPSNVIPQSMVHNGALGHQIPIAVPPGRGNMAPNLALTYNSYKKNGWVGVGWDLDMGAIQRSTKWGVDYGGNDFTATLNGSTSELIPNTSWGANYYGSKIEGSFSKFYYNPSTGGFIMTSKDGLEYYFGTTSASRQDNSNGVFKWCLDRVQDTNGNYMVVSYFKDQGQLYLDKISYAGNGTLSPSNYVQFVREARNDGQVKYTSKSAVITAYRLKQIEVVASSGLVRKYALAYEYGTSGQSRLSQVKLYGADGTSALPATVFDWQDGGGGTFGSTISRSLAGAYSTFGDINGDNFSDFVTVELLSSSTRIHSYLSDGRGGFVEHATNVTKLASGKIAVFLSDITGDGNADLVIQVIQNFSVIVYYNGYPYPYPEYITNCQYYTSDGSGSFDENGILFTDGPSIYRSPVGVADVSGDGLADIVRFNYEQSRAYTYIASGAGSFRDPVVFENSASGENNGVADFNADGCADLITLGRSVYVSLSNCDGTYANPVGSSLLSANNQYKIADVNGDSMADLVQFDPTNLKVYTFLADGTGGFSPYTTTSAVTAEGLVVDFNGDGLYDVVNYNDTEVYVALSKGNGYFEPFFKVNAPQGSTLMADVTGDGAADLIKIYSNTLYTKLNNDGGAADLLKSISGGSGASTSIQYTPSTAWSNQRLPFILPVVTSVATNDGLGNVSTRTISYEGGLYDFATREFRGFSRATQTNPDGSTVDTWFYQDALFKGKQYKTEAKNAAGTLLGRVTLTWEQVPVGSGSNFVRLKSKVSKSYDSAGTLSSQEDYTYSSTHGGVDTVTVSGAGAEAVTTDNSYANYGGWVWRLTQSTVSGSSSGTIRKANQGYESGTGNLLWKEQWNNMGDAPRSAMTYDAYGNLVTVTDPNGNTTTTYYDSATSTYPVKVVRPTTGGITHVIEKSYDYRFGQPSWVKDENGNVTYFGYDLFGRTNQVSTPDGGQALSFYEDNVFPQYVLTRVKEGTGSYIDKYEYFDGLGRNIQTITFGEGGKSVVTRQYYDEMSRAYRADGPYFATGVGYPKAQPAQYPWSLTTYDDRSRPLTIRSPNGTYSSVTVSFDYRGLATTVIDPDSKSKTEIKDYLGRLREVIEYADAGPQHTYYEYNAAGDLLKVTDAHGNITTINYDSLGRKINMTDPDMGYWQYAYDLNGNLKTQTDARGVVTTFTYDALGRIRTKTFSDPATSGVTYSYDTAALGKGKLASASNSDVTTIFNEYDVMGRVKSASKSIAGDANPYTTQYQYDLAGRVGAIVYPDNYLLNYTYHPGTSLLQSVYGATDFKEYAAYSNYEPMGQIGQIDNGNNTSTSYAYDVWSTRLTGLTTRDPSGLAANNIQQNAYVYTPAGDVQAIADQLTGVTYQYWYDQLHRLVAESSNSQTAPILPGAINTYDTNSPVHAVKSATVNGAVYDYIYDENGNLTQGPDLTDPLSVGTRTTTYNAGNMPVRIVHSMGGATDFVYDGEGGRAKKINGASASYYIGDHYEITNGIATRYIFAGSTRVAMVTGPDLSNPALCQTYYFHKDHLGSSTAITDAAGVKVSATLYLPYGGQRSQAGSTVSPYKYTDQEHDPETRLYNYNARLYDPASGMFASADTIVPNFSDPQSLNRYAYARGNPMAYTDPSGHMFLVDDILIGAAIGALIGGTMEEISGGDFADGMLSGAISGAFFGAAGGYIAESGIAISDVTQAGIHAAAGAMSGGINSAMTGGDVGLGILMGGVSGGAGKFAGPYLGQLGNVGELAGRSVIGGVMGGISAELYGGDFGYGFQHGAFTGAIGYIANDWLHERGLPGLRRLYRSMTQVGSEAPASVFDAFTEGARASWEIGTEGPPVARALMVSGYVVVAGAHVGYLGTNASAAAYNFVMYRPYDALSFTKGYINPKASPANYYQLGGAITRSVTDNIIRIMH